MHSMFRGFLENAPIKLIAVILFAILIPSVLVTALGLVAVLQADAFIRDRFQRPIGEKLVKLSGRLREEWGRRLDLYADYLRDAPGRTAYLRGLCEKDPCVLDILLTTPSGLERAPDPPPLELWSARGSPELSTLQTLELVEKNDAAALAECQRLLASFLEDDLLVEVQLAAARISCRLGQKGRALDHLRSALERFGGTMDSTGLVRELPILWRIFELERELNLEVRARKTAGDLATALRRHARHGDPEVLAFYEQKLLSLGEPFRPVAPLGSPEPKAGRLTALEASLPALKAVLPTGDGSPGGRARILTHTGVSTLGPLDFASFRSEGEVLWIHLLLDREQFLAEARLQGSLLGLSPQGMRWGPRAELTAADGSPRTSDVLSTTLPEPLENVVLAYAPVEGELPERFRGFNVLSLATFTWAVIVLVLTILVGVLFTVRFVLREMRTARMKSDFVSFISHELKTPLTAVRMFAETILSGRVENEEEERFCVQMIDQESERLSKLIDQILEYSRIEHRRKEFTFSSCDMESVVREAVRIFRDHNRQDPREIEVNSAQRISKIKMDRAAMVELLLNLLSNAAKYSPRDTKIVVNLRESIDDISVDVVDQGVGIRKRDQKKIFEKFYRADDYLTREVEGTGLGLTFARYIAKVHNGHIKVSSQLNQGSVFTLQIRKTDVLAE